MSLDDYDRLKVIGKGSYGEVWLAKHKADKKQVRVKICVIVVSDLLTK